MDTLFGFRETLERWIEVIDEEKPDVIILTEIFGLSLIAELGKALGWTPKGVLVTEITGLRCNKISENSFSKFSIRLLDCNISVLNATKSWPNWEVHGYK